MRPTRASSLRRVCLAVALTLAVPRAGFAEESLTAEAPAKTLSWETGETHSFYIPALEIAGFIAGLNVFNRFLADTDDYDSDLRSIRRNLTAAEVIDRDPFSTNQIGHPYQGSIYFGFARSAGLNYWQSLGYSVAGSLDYSIIYGLPGKPGYKYTRPFDYFQFEITAVPNADPISNLIENAAVRGLLLGTSYELGEDYRGLWGLFGSFDYLSPQVFRVSTTALSLGTVAQWWLTRRIALQGTVLGGVGFGAAGTVGDRAERDYHYGIIPEALVGLRAIFGERLMVDATGQQYYVAGKGAGGGISTSDIGGEIITRVNLGFTVRVYGPHGIGVQYLLSTRDTSVPGGGDRHQRVETVNLTYNFLGHTRFGAVEWRPAELAAR